MSKLFIIESVGYLEMVWLIDNSSLIMTDSIGLQEEAHVDRESLFTVKYDVNLYGNGNSSKLIILNFDETSEII